VARELERRWEDALREEQRLAEDYARFCQNQPVQLSDADHERLAALASDIPALWATAGPVDRQTIIRHLVERVEVDVADDSELVAVNIRWVGGGISQHTLLRPVGRYERLRDFPALLARICELREAGYPTAQIVERLNAEGFRSPKGDHRFSADRVRQFVSRYRLGRRPSSQDVDSTPLGPKEIWMTELAVELDIPIPTLTAWCRKGWAHARKVAVDGEPRWAVWVDCDEKARLQQLGSGKSGVPRPYPPQLTTPKLREKE
jgi:hypothetical protein